VPTADRGDIRTLNFTPTTGPADNPDLDGIPAASDRCPAAFDPSQRDTDGDGQGDACDSDMDNDGLNNTDEFARGTDLRKADTDGDGFSDRDEVTAGTDPRNPASKPMMLAGDVNMNGAVDAGDLLLVTLAANGEGQPLSAQQITRANVRSDGPIQNLIDVADVLMLTKQLDGVTP
jgi:hypothetical protein